MAANVAHKMQYAGSSPDGNTYSNSAHFLINIHHVPLLTH